MNPKLEWTVADSEVLGAGVGSGTRSVLMQEQAEDIKAGLPSQFVIGSGNAVVAVITEAVKVAQKSEASGNRPVFSNALRQLSGWQSRCVGDGGGDVVVASLLGSG